MKYKKQTGTKGNNSGSIFNETISLYYGNVGRVRFGSLSACHLYGVDTRHMASFVHQPNSFRSLNNSIPTSNNLFFISTSTFFILNYAGI